MVFIVIGPAVVGVPTWTAAMTALMSRNPRATAPSRSSTGFGVNKKVGQAVLWSACHSWACSWSSQHWPWSWSCSPCPVQVAMPSATTQHTASALVIHRSVLSGWTHIDAYSDTHTHTHTHTHTLDIPSHAISTVVNIKRSLPHWVGELQWAVYKSPTVVFTDVISSPIPAWFQLILHPRQYRSADRPYCCWIYSLASEDIK